MTIHRAAVTNSNLRARYLAEISCNNMLFVNLFLKLSADATHRTVRELRRQRNEPHLLREAFDYPTTAPRSLDSYLTLSLISRVTIHLEDVRDLLMISDQLLRKMAGAQEIGSGNPVFSPMLATEN